jgi:hypothetical protein
VNHVLTTVLTAALPRVIHKYVAHHTGSCSKEMRAILPPKVTAREKA